MKASEQLSQYPAAPWAFQGECSLSLFLQPLEQAATGLPTLLTPVPIFPGYTLAALLMGRFHDENDSPEWERFIGLYFSSRVRQGSRKGWFLSRAFTRHPGIYGGLQSLWNAPATLLQILPVQNGSLQRLTFHHGEKFRAQISFHPFSPAIPFQRSLSIFHEKNHRIHQSTLSLDGAFRYAPAQFRMERNSILPRLPRFAVAAFHASQSRFIWNSPQDIDLRGFANKTGE